ncbi:hypothetical protein GLOIN_2v1790114 [Rhizophagus irregularis DAOM 181602=DAOM 197198]|nr:hypothetical protein GLOIN_2v1790114 [Rhizophagus irregularis DAOM 181602=DAOM 197198]
MKEAHERLIKIIKLIEVHYGRCFSFKRMNGILDQPTTGSILDAKNIQESTITGCELFSGEMLKPSSEAIMTESMLELMVAFYNASYIEIDGEVDSYPGQIQYFFKHTVDLPNGQMEYNLAYIRWYRPASMSESRYYFHIDDEDVKLWKSEFYDESCDSSKHITNTIDTIFNFSNIENENINDQNYQQQIISTLNNTTRIFQQLTPHGELDYSTMIALQKCHEVYNSRPVERQNHTHAISHEQTNTINPNKAKNWKTMTANLANLQQNELSKRKCINKVASKIMCIESANITQDFPLQQNDYVIVLYGTKICIGKPKCSPSN